MDLIRVDKGSIVFMLQWEFLKKRTCSHKHSGMPELEGVSPAPALLLASKVLI